MKRIAPNSSVLIVLMGALGDVARGFSLLPPLRQALPEGRITWLIEPAWEDVVRAHRQIDEVIVFQRRGGWRGIRKLRHELRSRTFDYTLDMQRHLKSGIFSRWSGAPVRIGFHPKNSKEGNWLFNNHHIPSRDNSLSKVHHYQLFLEQLGLEMPTELSFGELALPDRGDLPAGGIAVVFGSSWASKDWLPAGYFQVARGLLETTGHDLVFLGARGQRGAADRVAAALESQTERVRNLVGETTLLELLVILRDAVAAFGPDSGPGHLAALFRTPYVALFGPTAPERVAPYGSEHLAVRSEIGCSPCLRRQCPGLNTLCMRLLSPAVVIDALDVALRIRSDDRGSSPITPRSR